MAAGIGSRYGVGIKQLEPVGLRDEIIMDYSIHDAIEAGFDKIIIVIRKAIEEDFRERIGDRIEKLCAKLGIAFHYVFQDLTAIPEGCTIPEGRVKPWGTGQAVLAAKEVIHEPFMVVNADDYYGRSVYRLFHQYLSKPHDVCCMAGYRLVNTLSENGGVTRGICKANGDLLADIEETRGIEKTAEGAAVGDRAISLDSIVSMNMWGFPAEDGKDPAYLTLLERDFLKFFAEKVPKDPLKAEYLLPIHIGELLKAEEIAVRILKTSEKWIGITYKEDMAGAKENFRKLIESGVYSKDLYSDL